MHGGRNHHRAPAPRIAAAFGAMKLGLEKRVWKSGEKRSFFFFWTAPANLQTIEKNYLGLAPATDRKLLEGFFHWHAGERDANYGDQCRELDRIDA